MPRIAIDRLSLRLSGLSEDQGRLLATRVTEGLAAAPVAGAASEHDAIQASAAMLPGGSLETLAAHIVADLVRQLQRTL